MRYGCFLAVGEVAFGYKAVADVAERQICRNVGKTVAPGDTFVAESLLDRGNRWTELNAVCLGDIEDFFERDHRLGMQHNSSA